jgi:hypothetical protein
VLHLLISAPVWNLWKNLGIFDFKWVYTIVYIYD